MTPCHSEPKEGRGKKVFKLQKGYSRFRQHDITEFSRFYDKFAKENIDNYALCFKEDGLLNPYAVEW
jgi:hypothetical protein